MGSGRRFGWRGDGRIRGACDRHIRRVSFRWCRRNDRRLGRWGKFRFHRFNTGDLSGMGAGLRRRVVGSRVHRKCLVKVPRMIVHFTGLVAFFPFRISPLAGSSKAIWCGDQVSTLRTSWRPSIGPCGPRSRYARRSDMRDVRCLPRFAPTFVLRTERNVIPWPQDEEPH